MAILYVEDEADLAEIVVLALERAGQHVVWVDNGREGWQRASEENWTLVISAPRIRPPP